MFFSETNPVILLDYQQFSFTEESKTIAWFLTNKEMCTTLSSNTIRYEVQGIFCTFTTITNTESWTTYDSNIRIPSSMLQENNKTLYFNILAQTYPENTPCAKLRQDILIPPNCKFSTLYYPHLL